MAGKYRFTVGLQPLVQRAYLRRFRAIAVAVQLFIFDDRHAAGEGQVHQHSALLGQAVEDVIGRGFHRQVQQRQRLDFLVALAGQLQGLHGTDLQ